MLNGELTSTPFVQDILAQPDALADTLNEPVDATTWHSFAKQLASGELQRIVLTGMGASYFVLYPLLLTLLSRGLTAQMIETSELIHYAPALIERGTLIVAVSQSGSSVEALRLLEKICGKAPLIGITNTVDSPLAMQADAVMLTRAGEERTVSCKTNMASFAALMVLGDLLAGQDPTATRDTLKQACEALAWYLAHLRDYVDILCDRLNGVHHLTLTGRGPSLAAVGIGALTIKEAARFPAEGMSSAAFRHGPLEMVSDKQMVMVFEGSAPTADLNKRLIDDIHTAGGQAILVRETRETDPFCIPPVGAIARPIVEMLPAQMAAIALARLHKHEAGHFENIEKITSRE